MTVYYLFQNITAIQTLPAQGVTTNPSPSNLPLGSVAANFASAGALNPGLGVSTNQAFELVVTCTTGNCSATATVLGSNDGLNWTSIGTITASSGVSPNIQTGSGSVAWPLISAYVTAISGTGAKATLTMNA